MDISRKDVVKILDFIRKSLNDNKELKSVINIDMNFEGQDLIYGMSNEYLSDLIETITGNKVRVVGQVEELFGCPCCGYKTLSEPYNIEKGTGYAICPFCGWEDDGTTDINEYKAINQGSINGLKFDKEPVQELLLA